MEKVRRELFKENQRVMDANKNLQELVESLQAKVEESLKAKAEEPAKVDGKEKTE
jgi:hypothetical protein